MIQDRFLHRIQIRLDRDRMGFLTLVDCRIGILQAITGQGADNFTAFRNFAGLNVAQSAGQ